MRFIFFTISILVCYIVIPQFFILNNQDLDLSIGDTYVADLSLCNDSTRFDTILIVNEDNDNVIFATDYSNFESPKFVSIGRKYLKHCIIK